METPRQYETLGTTEEWDACDCCGRSNLKVYVVMKDEDGEVFRFGTGCAAKLEKVPAATIRKEARDADRATREQERREQNERHAAERARFSAWMMEQAGTTDQWEAAKVLGLDSAYKVFKAWKAAA